MANSNEEKLTEELLKKYYDLSTEKKEIEKDLNQIKKQIHSYLDEQFGEEEKGEVKIGKYKVQRTIRSSIKYDDEKTIQKLEDLNLEDFILQVKLPDTEKLESAMKLDLVNEDEFSGCKKEKRSRAITVKELSL
ncbi:hypothetical protein [Alkalibacillus silvisoli]|uniref:Uncharacterized protein n=1 Tax=Alkalibacillus silvisoli TaxID=392823 RepID=A0ABN1A175_9BACI